MIARHRDPEDPSADLGRIEAEALAAFRGALIACGADPEGYRIQVRRGGQSALHAVVIDGGGRVQTPEEFERALRAGFG